MLIFLGADRERRGKEVEPHFLCEPCRFAETQLEAFAAALAAFFLFFEPACNLVELLGVVFALDELHRILRLERGDKPLDFFDAVGVFLGGGDIRVVVENRDVEELREVLDAVGTAGAAAGVHQERRHVALPLVPTDNVAQVALVVVIRFGHFANLSLVPVERAERGYPEADGCPDGKEPHDGAFLVARAKEHRGGIEREVYREEEREYARDFEREEHRQDFACAEQRVHREQLHADGDDERLANFLGYHLVATVHGVHAERCTERESDIQCDGWQKENGPDDGRDNHYW